MMAHKPEPEQKQTDFVECLSQQINELDLLRSMYPKNGEIIISDKDVLEQINSVLNGDSEYLTNNLEFVINLIINIMKLEIWVNLPVTYPEEEPDIYVRCNQLNRQQESKLNAELSDYITNNHVGEVCLYNAISWLQDNIDVVALTQINEEPISSLETYSECSQGRLTRLWIYSHHIYNKKKRELIIKKCKELNLTGFCLPGKPGVLCVEGEESACKEWWQDIKSMSWKKIVIRKTETFECSEKLSCKKFSNFEELHFETTAPTKHGNMREFSKYMRKHGLSHIFNELFGLR